MTTKKKPSARAAKRSTYTILPDRMPRIARAKLTATQRKLVDEMTSGPRGGVRGPFVALMRSPRFMEASQHLATYLRFKCLLSERINRMATLMTARHWTQQYEWERHAPFARAAGLKAAIIDAIADGRRPAGMAKDEEITYDFVTELLNNKSVCDQTYKRALAVFGEAATLELVGVVGYYAMLAMILNVARTELNDGAPFPLPPMPQHLRYGK